MPPTAAGQTAVPAGRKAPTAGRTDATAKQEAIDSIPWDRLTPEVKNNLLQIVRSPSMYRRMPEQSLPCDPELYLFLVRHPEVVVDIWQMMGVTRISINRTGPYTYRSDDGAGTISDVQLVYGTPELNIFYGTGYYEGPLLKGRIQGRCVAILRSVYRKDSAEEPWIDSRLDVFLQLDNVGADLLVKTVHPLVGRTSDINFTESIIFVSRLSHTSETNSAGLQALAGRLPSAEPEVRDKFAQIVGQVPLRSVERAQVRQLEAEAATLEATPVQTGQAALDQPQAIKLRR